MTDPANSGFDWKWISTTILAIGILAVTLWAVRQESARTAAAADASDRRMARIETAVHVLAVTQGEKTRQLVDEALTVSQNPASSGTDLIAEIPGYLAKGDNDKAVSAVQGATSLINSAKALKTPVPPGYFMSTLSALNHLAIPPDSNFANELFATRMALAEYESALEVSPDFPPNVVSLPIASGAPLASAQIATPAIYRATRPATLEPKASVEAHGSVIRGADLPLNADVLKPAGNSFAANGNSVEGIIFDGVTQTLDGVAWKNVVFVNARIRYHGGDLKLDHVRFVHCTFDVPQSAQGMQFANYATLSSNVLSIG